MAPAAKGHFGSFWGRFGARVLTKLTNVPYNAQMEAFTASFCGMLGGFQTVIGSLGVFGVQWLQNGPKGPLRAL